MRPNRVTFHCASKRGFGLLISALVVAVSSCSTTPSQTNVAKPPAVAQAYFDAMAVHDWTKAAGYLMPSMRGPFLHGPYSGAASYASISHIHVLPGGPDHADETGDYRKLYLPYSDLWELAVDYNPAYVSNSFEATMHRGGDNTVRTQFIILGRKNGAGPWQIISIGSGP